MGGYEPKSGSYDELVDENGKQRPHWKSTSEHLGSLDQTRWLRREQQLNRLINDNGITYNVYDETASKTRPWSVDMVPLAISQKEMTSLEASLSQRAHLLNLILGDVYGRQTMLQSSKMHPYLVFSNPSFLRPCHGLLPSKHSHIQLYAADLVRAPDGQWRVVADRVEAASGLGYALENRMLMSRIFPKAIWQANILSLQPFIQKFCQHIESMAASSAESPTIALLTAGPKNESYFEQSFLARNLGYTLAEGEDLTVRSNRLYMKTINGVQQVHGLLRRVDSPWIDPLELRNESLLGVPGIVNAVRQRNLSLVNALGSGFVEAPALLAFLPWFCRNYLGEGLEMPSIGTWWCGQKAERDYVIENLEKLTISPTFRKHSQPSYYGPKLSKTEKENLTKQILRYPERYCGQEIVSQATTPSYEDGKLQPRNFIMRVFLVADGNGWKMMPGGLVRHPSGDDSMTFSMQHGGESKDVWVIRDPALESGTRAAAHINLDKPIHRNHTDLPSRTADNMHWLGRYIERAESLARLLRTLTNFLTEDMSGESQRAITPLLDQILPTGESTEKLFYPETERIDISAAEPFLIRALFSEENPESLVNNLHFVERAGAKVKERFSIDTWKRMQRFRELANSYSGRTISIFDDEVSIFIDDTLENLAIFIGNAYENMTRSQGWSFMQIGRRIERALAISSLLQTSYSLAKPYDERLDLQLLYWADSSITYRRRYLNTISSERVIDLLCFDPINPRSLVYQIEKLRKLLSTLPHATLGPRNTIDTLSLQLFSRIGLSSPEALFPADVQLRMKTVHEFFGETTQNLLELATALQRHYFAHTIQSAASKPTAYLG
ncbi:conserved domain protein [Verrucomicrobiia bacterium DG1235]|nr:conserved domain protein [Verrucomicrobiae bacterium DG1235]